MMELLLCLKWLMKRQRMLLKYSSHLLGWLHNHLTNWWTNTFLIMTKNSLRDYQQTKLVEVMRLLKKFNLCYLIGQQRTGKTRIALMAMDFYIQRAGWGLFLTKKKAIASVENDYKELGLLSKIYITNYEQLPWLIENMRSKPRVVVLDEAHCLGRFPKPAKYARLIKRRLSGVVFLLMSGTPTPESFSQIFHQFWVTGWGPWTRFKTFYKWAKEYVNVEKVYIAMGRTINNYANAKDVVPETIAKFSVTLTRKEAGFKGRVIDRLHIIDLPDECRELIRTLNKKRLDLKRNIIADTASKLMQSVHQISSGTYIDDDGNRKVISKFKVDYIKKRFAGRKIAIFYVYVAEGDMLKKAFKNWTDVPDEFNKSKNKTFICQIVSGKEGTNLSTADDLIFFNIAYSS